MKEKNNKPVNILNTGLATFDLAKALMDQGFYEETDNYFKVFKMGGYITISKDQSKNIVLGKGDDLVPRPNLAQVMNWVWFKLKIQVMLTKAKTDNTQTPLVKYMVIDLSRVKVEDGDERMLFPIMCISNFTYVNPATAMNDGLIYACQNYVPF